MKQRQNPHEEHAAQETGGRLTTLDPSAGCITIINRYTVARERAEELLNFLVRATNETIRYVPGFVSANYVRARRQCHA